MPLARAISIWWEFTEISLSFPGQVSLNVYSFPWSVKNTSKKKKEKMLIKLSLRKRFLFLKILCVMNPPKAETLILISLHPVPMQIYI